MTAQLLGVGSIVLRSLTQSDLEKIRTDLLEEIRAGAGASAAASSSRGAAASGRAPMEFEDEIGAAGNTENAVVPSVASIRAGPHTVFGIRVNFCEKDNTT